MTVRAAAAIAALCASALCPLVTAAQFGIIAGRVVAAETGQPLAEARIDASRDDGAVTSRVYTAPTGRFVLDSLPAGIYRLAVTLIGYAPLRARDVEVRPGAATPFDAALRSLSVRLDPVVVTVRRSEERALDAPATVTVVSGQTIEDRPAIGPIEHVRDALGVDVAAKGVIQSSVVTRGFNDAFSGSLLVLTDGHYDIVPSLRVNAPWLIPTPVEDIERLEVVLGPAAAIYGPNAASGVLQIITKSPLDSRGTTISGGTLTQAGSGTASLARAAIRHAATIGAKWGYKLTGEALNGQDWHYVDPAEQSARDATLTRGARPDTLLIGRRDFGVRRWSGEARLDYRAGPEAEATLATGRTIAVRALELTGVGAAQVRDWTFASYQARVRLHHFSAHAFLNTSDAGETFLLRTGTPIVDRSRMAVAHAQHGFDWGERRVVLYGVDAQYTQPRTFGTVTGRNDGDDAIMELGGYVHTEAHLTPEWKVLAAARVDRNRRLDHAVVSPRAAVVFEPREAQRIRLTYNRAFETPNTTNLFLDLIAGTLPFPAIDVRTVGVPGSGFTFRRDCPELCMRSPFVADRRQALPADGTLAWAGLVASLPPAMRQALASVPPPSAADVRTVLRILDPLNLSFRDATAAAVRDVPPLRESVTNTLELGYKGLVGERLRVSVDLYHEWRTNFVGPLMVETPSVFLDAGIVGETGTLATYLARYMPPADAQAIALAIGGRPGFAGTIGVPLGTVAPEGGLASSPDILLTFRNFGALRRWGSDLSCDVVLSDRFSLAASYSWTNKNLFPAREVGGNSDIALNAPSTKGALTMQFTDTPSNVSAAMRARYVAGFPMNSGVYVGSVPAYSLVDASVAVRPSWHRDVLVAASIQNIFDVRHREMVGAPTLGRFVVASAQYSIR